MDLISLRTNFTLELHFFAFVFKMALEANQIIVLFELNFIR